MIRRYFMCEDCEHYQIITKPKECPECGYDEFRELMEIDQEDVQTKVECFCKDKGGVDYLGMYVFRCENGASGMIESLTKKCE